MNQATSGWVILTRKSVAGFHPQNDNTDAEERLGGSISATATLTVSAGEGYGPIVRNR